MVWDMFLVLLKLVIIFPFAHALGYRIIGPLLARRAYEKVLRELKHDERVSDDNAVEVTNAATCLKNTPKPDELTSVCTHCKLGRVKRFCSNCGLTKDGKERVQIDETYWHVKTRESQSVVTRA